MIEQSLKNLQRKRGEESQELDKLRQELETSQHRITTFGMHTMRITF